MRPVHFHLKQNWRVPDSLEKVIPGLKWWLEESNVLQSQPLHPLKHALQLFIDASKEGWALTQTTTLQGKPGLLQATHKLPGSKGGIFGPKRVPRPLPEQRSSYSHRQHNSGCLYRT